MPRCAHNSSPLNKVVVTGNPNAVNLGQRLGLEPMRYLAAYLLLIVVSSLDIILTYLIIFHEQSGFIGWEVNPFANRVIEFHGHWGMIAYKFALMVFFIVMCEEIGRRKPQAGQKLSKWAIAISSIPILWGAILLLRIQ